MAVDGTTAWVVATDSGHLIRLDLATATETARIDIGPGAAGVIVGDDGQIYVGRYDTGTSGESVIVANASATETHRFKGSPLGGIAAGEAGTIWVLEKAGRVAHLDGSTGRSLGSMAVTVDANEHMEIVAGAGARWLSSDHSAVRRIAGDATVAAEIETGGGIPLTFADGFVWGARADQVWGIDPASNTVKRRVPLDGVDEILAMDVAAETAWIAVRRPGRVGHVIAINLADGSLLWDADASLPAAVELATDRVWVTDYEADTVLGFRR